MKGKGPMGNHYKKNHPGITIPNLPFNTKIVKSCKDWVDRKIWEAVEIKDSMPAINIQHSMGNNTKKEYEVDTWALT